VTFPLDGPSFVTVPELRGGALSEIVDFYAGSPDYLAEVVVTASQDVEDRCGRRFLPFLDLPETHIAEGIDPDGSGFSDGLPLLGLSGALALSSAHAYGYGELVRDVWVHNSAPRRQELWQYTACSVTLTRPWGDTAILPAGAFTGPTVDTGHIRFRLGTLCPMGTEITVLYSGGYTLGSPHALKQATRLMCAKRLILEVEPEQRPGTSLTELDDEITGLLAEYAKY